MMKVKCKYANISALDSRLHGYSFDQDENGVIDITIGKVYDVYGFQENSLGKFYLVLTDELNSEMPWWMPAGLYEIRDNTFPNGWIKKEKEYQDGENIAVYSYPIYFDAEEDIEDSTEKGFKVFTKMQKYLKEDQKSL